MARAVSPTTKVLVLSRHAPNTAIGNNSEHVPFDITKPFTQETKLKLKDVDALVNLTGIMYERNGNTFENVHVEGVRHIVDYVKGMGCRYVHVSAIGADKTSDVPYARTKGLGEEIAKEYWNSTIIRPSIVFGREDDFFNVSLSGISS